MNNSTRSFLKIMSKTIAIDLKRVEILLDLLILTLLGGVILGGLFR